MFMLKKVMAFLTVDIWRIRLKDLSRSRSFFIKHLRVSLVAFRRFNEDKCQLAASALTFYSLLSIVPVLALAFGIAKGFDLDKLLERQLLEKLPGQQDVLLQIMDFANKLLENTKGGLVAGVGIALLFWTVIKVLASIESAFNDIWGIKQLRSLGRKFSDYLSIMLICPILIIISSSATVFIAGQVTTVIQKIQMLGFLSPLVFFIVKFLPFCILWVLFTFIYIFMPNTKVNFKSGLLGGIIAGTTYQIVQWTYIAFQVKMSKSNAIYGSFAALPLFLVWLQWSWLIILLGAEISFAHQNVDMYEFEPDCLKASLSFKKLLSLRIAHLLVMRFSKAETPLDAAAIAHMLEVPIRLVRQVLYDLTACGILAPMKGNDHKDAAYQPARDIDMLSIQYVLKALENYGVDDIPLLPGKELASLIDSLKEFDNAISASKANKLLRDIK